MTLYIFRCRNHCLSSTQLNKLRLSHQVGPDLPFLDINSISSRILCSLLILKSYLFLLIFTKLSMFTNFTLQVFMLKQLLNQFYIILTGGYVLIIFISSSSHGASRSIMSSFARQDYAIHLLFSCSMKASYLLRLKS